MHPYCDTRWHLVLPKSRLFKQMRAWQLGSELGVMVLPSPDDKCFEGLRRLCVFKAGLIILEAEQAESAGYFSHLAFAFIAGLNVDKFVVKLEDVNTIRA